MTTTIRIAISIKKTLFDQTEALAQQLNISRSHLFEAAVENFIKNYHSQTLCDEINKADEDQPDSDERATSACPGANSTTPLGGGRTVINQGDVYWIPLEEPSRSELGYTHPHVVIQDNVLNRSRINTLVVCALTSNIKRAQIPGNVLLEAGEANLPRQSVVVVSQVSTVDRTQLGEYIGSLTGPRISQILAGMKFLQWFTEPREADEES